MNKLNVSGPHREAEIGWLTRERALVLVLIIATALAFYLCYRLLSPFFPALAWALALAVVTHPLHEWIARQIHYANIAAGLSVVIVASILVAPAIFVTERLVREAATGVEMMKAETATGRWRAAVERNPQLAPILHWIETQMDVRGEVQRAANALTSRLSSFLTGSIWMMVELLITFFTLFFFFRDRRVILRAMRSLVPLSVTETDEVFLRVADTVYATIYGTLVVAIVQGALGGLTFWWL